jgi:hypothetical protein
VTERANVFTTSEFGTTGTSSGRRDGSELTGEEVRVASESLSGRGDRAVLSIHERGVRFGLGKGSSIFRKERNLRIRDHLNNQHRQ